MSFTNIIGQDVAIKALKNIIAQGQISGAYLFLGPNGIGKRTTAIEFSKAINCENKELDSCDNCASCNKIQSLNHPDIFIIEREEGSNFIKIEKVREIIYQASLKPYEARKKVFIIVGIEAMTEEAQNALLKILEEPPEHQILILTSSHISGILPTALSRCKALKFNLLSQSQIHEFLIQKRNFTETEAILFSHMAMGSLARAIELKEKDLILHRDKVLDDFIFRKRALFKEDIGNEKKCPNIEESLQMLLCWYRDLLVAKFIDTPNICLNIDRYDEVYSYANKFSKEGLENNLNCILKTIGYIRGNVNPKIALFNMALELKN